MNDADWYMYSLFLELLIEDLEDEVQEIECNYNWMRTFKDYYKYNKTPSWVIEEMK